MRARERQATDPLRRVAAALVVLAVLVFAAVASAQLGASTPTAPDTEYTPVAKADDDLFRQLGGADFKTHQLVEDSPTPASVDLDTVRFFSEAEGMAAGAACPNEDTAVDQLENCKDRVPVIYHYVQPDGEKPRWEEVYRGDTPGYVGAIAYLGADRVLAVGGTGSYPRREPPAGEPDPAGKGRAWLYSHGAWHELKDLPADMGGMTALDASPRPEDCSIDAHECAVAGAVKQLWTWTDGAFAAKPFTDPDFRFRVRAIRFAPGESTATVAAVAVTSGCCAAVQAGDKVVEDRANDGARLLQFSGGKWRVQILHGDKGFDHAETLPDSYYALIITAVWPNRDDISVLATPGRPEDGSPEPASRIFGEMGIQQPATTDQDALFNRATGPALGLLDDSLDLTIGGRGGTTKLGAEATNPRLDDLRLVSGDGDVAGPTSSTGQPHDSPDEFMDWAVGSLRSTGQGAAYTTLYHTSGVKQPSVVRCPDGTAGLQCQVRSQGEITGQVPSQAEVLLPSFALNAFTYADETGAVGWAVGDKGAIVRLGAQAKETSKTAPDPPDLGTPEDAPLTDRTPYDPFRATPFSGAPGAVPALAARPLRTLAEPAMVPYGSPEPTRLLGERVEGINTIVMSRDGDEGWALGPANGAAEIPATTLYHYTRGEWRRCDTDGIPGQLPADPACRSLAGLRRYRDPSAGELPTTLFAAARVPLERDDDPSNDDEFEVVAVGGSYGTTSGDGRPVVLRYRDGRWSVDFDSMKQIMPVAQSGWLQDVAFSRPDDGWAASDTTLYHFNGRRWISCLGDHAGCDDPDNLLPTSQPELTGSPHFVVAGDRTYFGATRVTGGGTSTTDFSATPVILYHDPGGKWTSRDGGYDPGKNCPDDLAGHGKLVSLSVARNADGSYSGWAVGNFGTVKADTGANAGLLHLERGAGGVCGSDGGSWVPWRHDDVIDDYLLAMSPRSPSQINEGEYPVARQVTMPGRDGDGESLIAAKFDQRRGAPILRYDPVAKRWGVVPAPFLLNDANTESPDGNLAAVFSAMASDGAGGTWIAVKSYKSYGENDRALHYRVPTWFYRYTTTDREPVFGEVAHPIREQMTAAAAGADGSFWVATKSAAVYRYDRMTGWDSVRVRGWNASRLVTREAPAYGVAVGPDGHGVLVGERGRIADIAPGGAVLDRAAGLLCSETVQVGCGTTRDLRGAAVAPDGSALAVGDGRTVLWRPAGGEFRAVTPPPASPTARLTGVSMPTPARAWMTTDTGQVFGGAQAGGAWRWRLENIGDSPGSPVLNRGPGRRVLLLRGISVGADGEGYAVGQKGLLLHRTSDGAHPWERLDSGRLEDLTSVAVAGDGSNAIVGGDWGLVLTVTGNHAAVARQADGFDPITLAMPSFPGTVVGVGLSPGDRTRQTEAWAVEQLPFDSPGNSATYNRTPPPGAILHYSSDPHDPLLSPDGRVAPLPDTPAPRPGELTFAAFGKSECHAPSTAACPELLGSTLINDVVARRVADAIAARAKRPGGPAFAVFTGDGGDMAGKGSAERIPDVSTPADADVVHARWAELVAQRMAGRGVPVFGTVGAHDLSGARQCDGGNYCTASAAVPYNAPWRHALAAMPAPWGAGPVPSSKRATFAPIADGGREAPGGGARTHYALTVDQPGRPPTRLVVADTSLGSLSADDALQNPVADQTTWLQSALQRPADEQAVVLTTTPTYTYGDGPSGPGVAQTDAATFETLMLNSHVSAVVTGHAGWNGLYYACAAGFHDPAPAGSYPLAAPQDARACAADQAGVDPAQKVADVLDTVGAPAPPDPTQPVSGALPSPVPFVVASGAGGEFGPNGEREGSAGEGYWMGYSIVRVAKSGDPRETIVEQRPVLDWIGITAAERTLHAGGRLTLHGYGRQPAGGDNPLAYVNLNDPSLTHRFDLLEADPQRPYLPRRDADGNYVPLDPAVATIGRTDGQVQAGKGSHKTAYAVALLSVGGQAATYPMVFLPRRSFVPKPPVVVNSGTAARIIPAPPRPAPIVLGTAPASLPAAPPPPPPSTPGNLGVNLPPPPALNAPPPLTATPAASPAPPPPPPPPPAADTALPLGLSFDVPGLTIVPQTGTFPPPAPPVQPAPPSGARREARQRQAAEAKSHQGAAPQEQPGGEAGDAHGRIDAMDAPNQSMTRLDHNFSARNRESAWERDVLYGGALAMMALTLALGWVTVRPTPRRRRIDLAAPAWARRR